MGDGRSEVAPRTQLFEFPGGWLELHARGDENEVAMAYRPTAVGYLRTDVSGLGQLWDQSQIRRLATRLGYDFADMVIYDSRFGRPPLARLRSQATRLDAEAVIVPSAEHFEDGVVPGALVRRVDVITVNPEETYARRAGPPGHEFPGARLDRA